PALDLDQNQFTMITSTFFQRSLIAVLGICQWVNLSYAQQPPGPAVEWRNIMPAPQLPGWGTLYEWDANSQAMIPDVQNPTGPMLREDGGEDWWYAHCNITDGLGIVVGYATAGYNTVPNWGFVDNDGCFSETFDAGHSPN